MHIVECLPPHMENPERLYECGCACGGDGGSHHGGEQILEALKKCLLSPHKELDPNL